MTEEKITLDLVLIRTAFVIRKDPQSIFEIVTYYLYNGYTYTEAQFLAWSQASY